MGLIERIQGKRIYLDINIFLYCFEDISPYSEMLQPIIENIERDFFYAVTSELSLAEALVKPMKDNNQHCVDVYLHGIQTTPTMTVIPVDRTILIEAARIRSTTSNKLPDAIHLATALYERCDSFLTNDLQIKTIPPLQMIQLNEQREES